MAAAPLKQIYIYIYFLFSAEMLQMCSARRRNILTFRPLWFGCGRTQMDRQEIENVLRHTFFPDWAQPPENNFGVSLARANMPSPIKHFLVILRSLFSALCLCPGRNAKELNRKSKTEQSCRVLGGFSVSSPPFHPPVICIMPALPCLPSWRFFFAPGVLDKQAGEFQG